MGCLLVPTVGNRKHPLLVDEHATAEVVAIVQGGHEWPRVRFALLPADDPAVFPRSCHCRTEASEETGDMATADLHFIPNFSHISLQYRYAHYLHVCISVSLPAAPTISSRASSLMVSGECSEDTYGHAVPYLYPSSPLRSAYSRPSSHACFCWPHLHLHTVITSRSEMLTQISYRAPAFLFAHFCSILVYPLQFIISSPRQGLHTFNTCLSFSHRSLIVGKLQYRNSECSHANFF